MKNHLKGSCCGLLVFLILLPTLNLPSEWSAKSLYWNRFKLCAPCGEPRGLECVIEVCESDNIQEKSKGKIYTIPCSRHPDIINGNSDAFIRGFCGYEMYEGFGYGQKPNLIETIFSLRNYKNSFILLTMLLGPLALFVPVFFMLLGAIFQNWRARVRE